MIDAKKIEAAILSQLQQEKTLAIIMTLAVEYETKNITSERFATRVFETIETYAENISKV